jgi:RHS repeat-associated protein
VDADGDEDFDSERFFAYDGNQIVLAFDGDSDTDLTNRYLWGSVVDQILADEQVTSLGSAGDVIWPLTDHLGTARDLAQYNAGTDTTSVTNHRVYDSFGNLVSETNAAVDHLFGFTARPWDEETDLQYNLNRWYDPVIGQWMSEDPIGFAAGDANVRRYVGNVAISLKDPDGLQAAKPLTTGNYTEVKVAAGAFRYNFAILNNDVKHGITSQIEFHPNLDNNPGEIDLIQVVRTTDTKTKEHWDISENALSGRRDDRSVCVDQRTEKDPKGKYEADWWVDVRSENWAKKFKSPYYNDTVIYKGWTGKKGLVDLSGTTRPCIARDQPATSDFVWGVTYEFETVVVNRDTGEVLGALKWGFDVIKYKSGKWSVVPAPTKASDNASATFYATVNKFDDKFNPGTTLFVPE